MSRTTLNQYKIILQTEVNEIESLIERRKSTPELLKRLQEIETQLQIFENMKK